MLEKSTQYRQFTRQNALFDKTLGLVLSLFLVDPLPVLVTSITMKIKNEMNLSKFWIRSVTRILPSENYFIKKCSCQNALLPVKLP